MELYPQSVLQLWERHNMEKHPDKPRYESAHPERSALQKGEVLPDDRHVASIAVPKGVFWLVPFEALGYQSANISALLDRSLRDAGYRLPVEHNR